MNRSQVRTYFEDLLNKSNNTSALSDRFIDTAILGLQRNPNVRLADQVTTLNVTVDDTFTGITIPDDYLSLKGIWVDGDEPYELDKLPYNRWLKVDTACDPVAYVRDGSKFLIRGTPANGTMFHFRYYAAFADITGDTSSNILTVKAPDLVVYKALVLAADHYSDVRSDSFKERADEMLSDLIASSALEEFSGEAMAIRPVGGDY